MSAVNRLVVGALLGGALLAHAPVGSAEHHESVPPSGQETQFLYELNRARSNPAAWAAEYGLDLMVGGDGTFVTLIGVDPAPPLAKNDQLGDSANFKAAEMAMEDYFAHESPIGPNFFFPNELVRTAFDYLIGYPLPFAFESLSFPDDSAETEAIAAGYGSGAADLSISTNALAALIVDAGVPSLAHRNHLLGVGLPASLFTEAGVGNAFDATSTLQNYWVLHTGFTDVPLHFITGVVFDDLDANGLYDPGEGLGGVTVTVGLETVMTSTEGSYSAGVESGTHRVRCSGGGFDGNNAFVDVAVDDANVEVDCISGVEGAVVDFVPIPEPSAALAGAFAVLTLSGLFALRSTSRRARSSN